MLPNLVSGRPRGRKCWLDYLAGRRYLEVDELKLLEGMLVHAMLGNRYPLWRAVLEAFGL